MPQYAGPAQPGQPSTPASDPAPTAAQEPPSPSGDDVRRVQRVQRRTLALLVGTQIVGGVGVAVGIAVGALLAAALAGAGFSGLASSANVVGAALLALPVTRIMRARGRRPGLATSYLIGALGAVLVVVAANLHAGWLLFLAMLLFGGGSAANLQARYTAVDLAEPRRRGSQLSLVVWATTVGAVAGPNLAPLADHAVAGWRLREYSGPFIFSALAFAVAALAITVVMRPDPLLTARAIRGGPVTAATGTAATGTAGRPDAAAGGWRRAVAAIRVSPQARLAIYAISSGHVAMIAVMAMTPLHIHGYVHGHADMLRVVGMVLSLHIAGMYALSPLVGWLTDRHGRRPVILAGAGTLLLSCVVAATAGPHTPQLSVGLVLLGLGWSGTMVAGSTLLSESVDAEVRPSVQGLSDAVMGMAGALGGALAGVVVELVGYPTLAWLTAASTVPLIVLAVRRPRRREG